MAFASGLNRPAIVKPTVNSGSYNSPNYGDYGAVDRELDRKNIDRLQKSHDYTTQANAIASATERAKDSQENRDQNKMALTDNYLDRASNRDVNSKIRLMQVESNLKPDSNNFLSNPTAYIAKNIADRESASKSNLDYLRQSAKNETDRVFARDESDKNRLQEASQKESDRRLNRELADKNMQTQLSEQSSRTAQAGIAARAQVSAAILGNRPNLGGYW